MKKIDDTLLEIVVARNPLKIVSKENLSETLRGFQISFIVFLVAGFFHDDLWEGNFLFSPKVHLVAPKPVYVKQFIGLDLKIPEGQFPFSPNICK